MKKVLTRPTNMARFSSKPPFADFRLDALLGMEEENGDESMSERARTLLGEEIVHTWRAQQRELSKRLVLHDTEPWQLNRRVYDPGTEFDRNESLRYVAGLDISFSDDGRGCSGLYVFDLSDRMKLVYQDADEQLVEMAQPYVSGFLAFREAPLLVEKLEKLKRTQPDLYPQVVFIDGNGLLHVNKLGLACHLGILTDTPSIGVSKKLCQIFGLENGPDHKAQIKASLLKRGDHFELLSNEQPTPTRLAYCYRSTDKSSNPIYVSLGHKIGWEACLWLLGLVITDCRIPEPIRHADLQTRSIIRDLGGYAKSNNQPQTTGHDS